MARRRRPPEAERPTAATVPAELRECVVEDWLTPRELLGETPWAVAPEIVAHGRFRRARRAWLDEHNIPAECAPAMRPRHRHEATFLNERPRPL